MKVERSDIQRITPLSGKCIIEWDPLPDKIGSLFIPDSARAREGRTQEPLHSGRVLKMTPRKYDPTTKEPYSYPFEEAFKVGDHVLCAPTLEDLQHGISLTLNTRVYCVLATRADAASGD